MTNTRHPAPEAGGPLLTRRAALTGLGLVLAGAAAACAGPKVIDGKAEKPTGTVSLEKWVGGYWAAGTVGEGGLHFRGKDYPFTVGGFGLGGTGVAHVSAEGNVYGLTDPAKFAGNYSLLRTGFVLGNVGPGTLFMENQHGVRMQLQARRRGLMLSFGGDAITITMGAPQRKPAPATTGKAGK